MSQAQSSLGGGRFLAKVLKNLLVAFVRNPKNQIVHTPATHGGVFFHVRSFSQVSWW